jgi:prepilin-type N-terminal cleavage/methylation domain-containing protein/prepilin-type processing-associated H-X9-DG protein
MVRGSRRHEVARSSSVANGNLKARARVKGGFTLMELLVVVSIIGMLMSLLLPAVMAAREASRRATCANNLRNIGLALQNAAEARGRLPAAGNFSFHGKGYHNWVVDVLPYLERSDIYRQWRFDLPASDPHNTALRHNQIAALICPDDDTVVQGEGNLSYVVNGGFGWTRPIDCPGVMHLSAASVVQTMPIDLNGNGVTCPSNESLDGSPSDKTLFFLTDLFFVENWPLGTHTVRHRALGAVSDGLSQTILASENLRAGYEAATDSTWATPAPWRTCFFVSSYVCQDEKCSKTNVDWRKANDARTFESINPRRVLPEGAGPWPSSNHPGGVNVIFCDGHLKFLSENVDGLAYAAMITPEGHRIIGPLADASAGDSVE